MVLIFLIHFHILHPVDNFTCFLWRFAVILSFIKWGQVRQPERNPRLQEWNTCGLYKDAAMLLSYYNIFLPPKAKGQRGMVTMSLESPDQIPMITQSPMPFECRWIFSPKFPYSRSCENVPLPLDLHLVPPDAFRKHVTGVFSSPYEKILHYLQTWTFH